MVGPNWLARDAGPSDDSLISVGEQEFSSLLPAACHNSLPRYCHLRHPIAHKQEGLKRRPIKKRLTFKSMSPLPFRFPAINGESSAQQMLERASWEAGLPKPIW